MQCVSRYSDVVLMKLLGLHILHDGKALGPWHGSMALFFHMTYLFHERL